MSTDRRFKRVARTTMVAIALCISSLGAIAPSQALHDNKLPNPSFELSAIDPTGLIGYTNPQPLLPTGWAFEGAAALFDHSQNGKHTGRRMAAISGNASGNRNICANPPVGCSPNTPANLAKDSAERAFSVQPSWRNATPVAVTAGVSYTASSWVSLSFCTIGTGASIRVRWMSGSLPLSVTTFASRFQTSFDPTNVPTSWQQISGTFAAPAGATAAVVLLTYTDDLFIGQVMFDDVFFGPTA